MPLLTKRQAVLVVFLLAVAVVGCVLYRYQFRIRAIAWHLLHGDSVAVAGYRVAVPILWLVEQSNSQDATLWNTRTGESIWLHSFPKPSSFTLASWSDLVQKRMKDPKNLIVGRRELQVADEPFLCFERDFEIVLPSSVTANASDQTVHGPSVECTSTGPLDVMFYGTIRPARRNDYSQFYAIVGSIQKISR
jgi:hypothetical protein